MPSLTTLSPANDATLPDPADRRRSPRHPPRVGVACRLGMLPSDPNVAVGLLDLSEGGAKILSTIPLRPGERVYVTVALKGTGVSFQRPARVAWCRPTDSPDHVAGLAFRGPVSFAELVRLADARPAGPS